MRPLLTLILAGFFAGLPAADEIRGIVRATDGQPIPNVRVDIATAAPKVGPGIFCPSCYLDCAKYVYTDEDGRFAIPNLDSSLKFRLLATAPDKTTAHTELIDPLSDQVEIRLADFPTDLPPDQILQGVVLTDQGTPVAGALVSPYGAKTEERRWWGRVTGATSGVTDNAGRFRIVITEPYVAIDLQVTAFGYAGAIASLLTPGETQHSITLPVGATVRGKVMRRGFPVTDEPIAVTQVNRGVMDRVFYKAIKTTTAADGTFQISALPSDEPYAIFTPVSVGSSGPVIPTALFTPKGSGSEFDLGAINAISGITLSGTVRKHQPGPLPDSIRLTLGRLPAWDLIEVPVDSDGKFEIANLPPETYEIRLQAKDHWLDSTDFPFQLLSPTSFGIRLEEPFAGLEIVIRPQSDDAREPFDPRPLPEYDNRETGTQVISGIVVDPDGKPIPRIRITPRVSTARGPFLNARNIRSGLDGRFRIEGLPDVPICLSVRQPDGQGYPIGENGVSLLYSAVYCCQLNQEDVRLVLDTRLTEKPREISPATIE